MSIANTRQGYGWLAIALHWIAAISLLVLYLNGEGIEDAVGRPAHMAAEAQHIALGMAVFLILALRVVWSLVSPKPDPLPQNVWLRRLSLAIHWLLLADIVVLILAGLVSVWAIGRPAPLLGLEIPSLLPGRNRELHFALEQAHGLAAHLLVPLVALHVLGALKHLVVDRDRTLQRMLWVRSPKG
jgi:cytochrome b561